MAVATLLRAMMVSAAAGLWAVMMCGLTQARMWGGGVDAHIGIERGFDCGCGSGLGRLRPHSGLHTVLW